MPSVGIAVGVALLASVVQSIGLSLQRRSHLANEARPPARRRPDCARPAWVCGLLVYVAANVLGAGFELGTLPVFLLGPIGAVSLVSNAFLAVVLLGDRASPALIGGTLLVGLGAGLVARAGPHPGPAVPPDFPPDFPPERIFGRLARPTFIAFWVSAQAGATLLSGVAHWGTRRAPTKAGMAYAAAAGTLAGEGGVLGRAALEGLGGAPGEAWAAAAGVLGAALPQLWCLNRALRLAGPGRVVPLAFGGFHLCTLGAGLLLDSGLRRLAPVQAAGLVLGTLVLLAGVAVLGGGSSGPGARPVTLPEHRPLLGAQPASGPDRPDGRAASPGRVVPRHSTSHSARSPLRSRSRFSPSASARRPLRPTSADHHSAPPHPPLGTEPTTTTTIPPAFPSRRRRSASDHTPAAGGLASGKASHAHLRSPHGSLHM